MNKTKINQPSFPSFLYPLKKKNDSKIGHLIWNVVLPVLHRYEYLESAVQKVKQPRKIATMSQKMNLAYFSDEMLQKRGKSCRAS